MLINIQYQEASELLFELLEAIPEERRKEFSVRVNAVASELYHPIAVGERCAVIKFNTPKVS
jgi:hypothetical protein